MTLRECFDQHRGRPVAKIDHFFDVYEPHFCRYRGKPVRLLEIGVNRGGSLELWRKYFGTDASIHGIDINPKAADRSPPDTVVHIGSQQDSQFLIDIATRFGPFDIVIDDGSHLMLHQINSFEAIYPLLSPQGLYICEDAFTSYWHEYGGSLRGKNTFIEYAKDLIDELHAYWATDGNMLPTAFTKTTKSIHFYSGTVVFERQPISEPFYTIRHSQGKKNVPIDELKEAAGRNVPRNLPEHNR